MGMSRARCCLLLLGHYYSSRMCFQIMIIIPSIVYPMTPIRFSLSMVFPSLLIHSLPLDEW